MNTKNKPIEKSKIESRVSQDASIDITVEQYEKIVDFAHKEIEFTRTAYKWLLGLIAIIIVSGTWFTYKSFLDMKKDMEKDFKERFDILSKDVEKRVTSELNPENINKLVQSRVENVAAPLITKEIEDKLYPKIIKAEERLNILKNEASGTRKDLDELSEFMKTVIFAQNDGRQAFDQLKMWADDRTYSFNKQAELAWLKILDDYATSPLVINTISPSEEADLGKMSITDFKLKYWGTPSYFRLGLLSYIWNKRNDIPKMDKMEFLVDIMKKDESLRSVEYAGRLFKEKIKPDSKPLGYGMIDWWEKNKTEYEKSLQKEIIEKK